MDELEKQQIPVAEKRAEAPEKAGTEQAERRQAVIQEVANLVGSTAAEIESETLTVRQFFCDLPERTVEGTEANSEAATEDPDEITKRIEAEFSRLEHAPLEDMLRVLIMSGLEAQAIESWLAANEGEIQSILSEKEGLEAVRGELATRLAQEEQKNLLIRVFFKRKMKTLSVRLKEVADGVVQTDTKLAERQSHGEKIEKDSRRISRKRKELPFKAVERLFWDIVKREVKLRKELATPAVKQELNEDLIAREILPELNRLQAEEKITKEDAEEYLDLLRAKLARGYVMDWDGPTGVSDEVKERIKRRDVLRKRMDQSMIDLDQRACFRGDAEMDSYYDKFFDFLLHEATKEQVERLGADIGDALNPESRAKVAKIAERVITPNFDWRTPNEEAEASLKRLEINDFKQIGGLERWPVIKAFAESSGAIPKEVFARVEKAIVQTLFDEELFPNFGDNRGTEAVKKMDQIGNPEALPLMLRYIEAFNGGHTGNAAVYAMERLMKESDPAELQAVLESLPANERALLETLADENSYLTRFGRFNARYATVDLLQNGEMTLRQERYTKLLEADGRPVEELTEFYMLMGSRKKLIERVKRVAELAGEDEKAVVYDYFAAFTKDIHPDFPDTLRIIDYLARDLETPKAELLARCVERFESPPKNPMLRKITSPEDRDYGAFPVALAKEKFGLDDESSVVLSKIYKTKPLQSSALEREFYIEGLLMLKGKENGKAVLEALLGAYRGTKDDPKRIRRIFQMLSTLQGFGEYDFVVPDQNEAGRVSQEIVDLQNQYAQTADKAERKGIKNRMEGLTVDLQNLTGLKGIEDAMTRRVVEAACRKLDLPPEYREKMEKNLEELLKSGLFEIVPALAGNYEKKNEKAVKNLLRTITMHIIEGDFQSWRYAHEKSEAQLAGLTADQKEFWKGTVAPVTIEIEPSEDEMDKRAGELKTAQEIIKNAKAHVLDSQPAFDFSEERARALAEQISELTGKIVTAASEAEKKRFISEKRAAQAEAALINGVLEIENATPRSFTKERMLAQARELRERIAELNLPLAGLDIEQIGKIFTVGDIKSVTASESDDALTLLKVGVEPQETCQSWRGGGYNECLLAYVADSNKKVINVADGEGKIIARTIIKLTDQRNENDRESKTKRKTLLVEKPYTLLSNGEVYRAMARVLFTKARGIDASITIGKGFGEAALKIFEEEASAVGYGAKAGSLEVFIPPSLNEHEYSDTLGGKISWFDRYQELEAVSFEKVAA